MNVKLTAITVCFSFLLPCSALLHAHEHGAAAMSGVVTKKEASPKVDMTNPYLLIESVANQTFGLLKKDQQKYAKNPELLRGVAKNYIMPYINVRYAALKVLGPAARKATKAQRDAFTKAFSDYLAMSYAQILTQYTDQKVVVEPQKNIDPKRKIASVRVDIQDISRPPIRMDFKLRKNNKTHEWQGFDVQVEGVSMLDTKSSEWSGVLRQEGIDKVTKMLLDLAKKPISKEEVKK